MTNNSPEPVPDFGPERGSAKGTIADLSSLVPQLRLGYIRVGELHYGLLFNLSMALDFAV